MNTGGRGVMSSLGRAGVALVAVAALGSGCSGSDDGSSSGAPSSTTRRDAPGDTTTAPTPTLADEGPEEPGRYGVGRTTVELVDAARNGRALTADVWYPIVPAPDAAPSTYQFDAAIPAIDLQVAKADQPIATDGPFPVVVFSHGSPSIRYQSAFFTELLASHGYVVIAPDHAGDSAVDALRGTLADPAATAIDRPADISFVIDALLRGDIDQPAGLTEAVDPDRIGLVGHSGGGDTVLAVAGGRSGVAPDERIDAVVAWTPSTVGLNDESLAAIDDPTMLFGATLDDIAPTDPNIERAWSLVTGRPLYRVELQRGGHDQFTDVCDFLAAADADSDFPAALRPVVDVPAQDACTPEFLPIDVAHRLIARYSLAFLDVHVAGDAGAAVWLTPESAATTREVVVSERP